MSDGTLRAFTDLGSYPLFYRTASCNEMCAKCAHEGGQTDDPTDKETFLVEAGVHWEGDPITCDVCGEDIKSAYGPLGEDQVEDHIVIDEESNLATARTRESLNRIARQIGYTDEHGPYCNCEDCHHARGGEICATCGCLVGAGCPESGT